MVARTTTIQAATRVLILTTDQALHERLSAMLLAAPVGRYIGDWAAPARSREISETADVMLLDARRNSTAGVPWHSGTHRFLPSVPVVWVVDEEQDEHDSADEFETIVLDRLTPAQLDRVLRRIRRDAALVQQVRQLNDELAARTQAHVAAEQAWRRHDELLQGIVRALPILIGRVDREGVVREARGAGFGRGALAAERLLGQRLELILPAAAAAWARARAGETTRFVVHGDEAGMRWQVEFLLLPERGAGEGCIFLGQDRSERAWLEQQLLTAVDAEQQRIGADLHDGLGQELTGLACQSASLRDRLRDLGHDDLAAQAQLIVEVANGASRQSRALARGLCPVQLETGSLVAALDELAQQTQQLHGIRCVFRPRSRPPQFDAWTAMQVYRITQEALHNAIRHGHARNVRVWLVSRATRHRLVVQDDGCGFDPRQPPPPPSRGLRLMHYRAGLIAGSLRLVARPGGGTRIVCDFITAFSPYEEQ
ncbi:MAG TPA: sensor histidine kinase [Candidatus Synoicihabitans sp.]|nr:sensor histidine kinase [Candidatus Synoicihabitans sp.]